MHRLTTTTTTTTTVDGRCGTSSSSSSLLWLVTAGLAGDARTLVHRTGVPLRVVQAADRTAQWQHRLTCQAWRRPLGVTALVLGMDSDGEEDDDKEECSSSSPRLFRCSPGGMKEDCLYCAAGKEQDLVQDAIANEYDRLLQLQQQQQQSGSLLSPSEVVERLVKAVQEGLGYDNRQRLGVSTATTATIGGCQLTVGVGQAPAASEIVRYSMLSDFASRSV